MDLFVVPTIGFKLLYGFVIIRLDRRDLVWISVTTNPTAEWIARQITEAFPGQSGIAAAPAQISNYVGSKIASAATNAAGVRGRARPPGTEFFEAETGRQKPTPKCANCPETKIRK